MTDDRSSSIHWKRKRDERQKDALEDELLTTYYNTNIRMRKAVREANYVAQRWGTKAWSNWGGVHE
jgi:hypothetical protein